MLKLKLTFSNGDTVLTKFNGTPTEAFEYYMNKHFNMGSRYDQMVKCTNIQIIPVNSNIFTR